MRHTNANAVVKVVKDDLSFEGFNTASKSFIGKRNLFQKKRLTAISAINREDDLSN